ncbi:MAG: ATP-binding cassette domain-containing protein [Bacteroidales bacterium]|nr:ATP-binding cassette domain-containing protein [Bacteroidales bacterium]
MELLVAEHVEKNYSGYRALDDVSIAASEGRILGLLGPNGAGKTTLIRIINRITAPDKGTVLFCGEPLSQKHVSQIGYLPEERGLYKKMKVGEQAMYLARLKGLSKGDAEQRLRQWFERFEIMGWWNKKVEELSKGMQQKVQFIVTVLHEPKLLIFDEPFSGFDPINANLLKQEILRLKSEGATVLFSTHNMASVEEICDDITLVNKSKVVLSGNVREIRESYRKNIFDIRCCKHGEELTLSSEMEIVQQTTDGDETDLRVRVGNTPSNELLRQLIGQADVLSFQEVLPSMNEIFIEAVTANNQQN